MPAIDRKQSRYYEITSDPGAQFWLLHLVGWLGISLVTYLSLSLPYDQFEFRYLAHNLAQSLLGLALSLPMRYIFRAVWDWPVWPRVGLVLTSVLILSTAWSVVRLVLFMLMTGERGLWADFGGWWFPSIFVFLTWAALYHGVKYHQLLQREHESLIKLESQQRQEALGRVQAESAAREAQLRLLRYQLNPHFLFNTLNSVSALINTQRAEDAKKMLLHLSHFLRYSLDSDEKVTTSLQEEIAAASLYLEIERVRFFDRLVVEMDISPEVLHLQVPSLLLQPLLENSIKYAISEAEQGGVIRITAETEALALLISVEDSGPDQPEKQSVSYGDRTGIGLANTEARLATLYGEDFSLDVGDSPLGGVSIRLRVPLTEALSHGG